MMLLKAKHSGSYDFGKGSLLDSVRRDSFHLYQPVRPLSLVAKDSFDTLGRSLKNYCLTPEFLFSGYVKEEALSKCVYRSSQKPVRYEFMLQNSNATSFWWKEEKNEEQERGGINLQPDQKTAHRSVQMDKIF